MIDYDSELRRHHHRRRRAFDVHHRDRVLDIGCGTGETTRDAALIATDGRVFGIDTAERALQHARRLTLAAGLRNVDYVCSDASRHPFPPAWVDVVISRFGTMFLADPITAFTSIRGVLRPAGRLVMMVWQAAHRNAWAVAIHRALVDDEAASPEKSSGPSAFSLSDANTVEDILRAAGLVDIAFEQVDEPVYYGPDVESALGFVLRFSTVMVALDSQRADERATSLDRLRDLMVAHRMHDGVWFVSRAWIVTARALTQQSTVEAGSAVAQREVVKDEHRRLPMKWLMPHDHAIALLGAGAKAGLLALGGSMATRGSCRKCKRSCALTSA
ncbi:MAG: methyltransferase domain-containing protein [Gemmatimonadaceae bacterium]